VEGVQELLLEIQQMTATIAQLRQEVQADCLKNSQSHVNTAAHTKHSFAEVYARIDGVHCEMRSQEWVDQADVAL